MKPNKSRFKTIAVQMTVSFVALASLFGIGFSSFLVIGGNGPTRQDVGGLNIAVGDTAIVEVDPQSIVPFTISQQGFLQADQSYGPTASIRVGFSFFVSSESSMTMEFVLRQVDRNPSSYPGFDFTQYVSKMTLVNHRQSGGAEIGRADMVPSSLEGEHLAVSASVGSGAVNAYGAGVKFAMTLEIHIDVSKVCAPGKATDFAKNIYLPLYENDTVFDLEVNVRG